MTLTRVLPIPFRIITRVTGMVVVIGVVAVWMAMDPFFTEVEWVEQNTGD